MLTLVCLYILHSQAAKFSVVSQVRSSFDFVLFQANKYLGRREVLDGMLGANLVVFQKFSYGRHFGSSCIRVCGYESVQGGIDVQGQVTRILHCSVGVDAERVAKDTYVSFHLLNSQYLIRRA